MIPKWLKKISRIFERKIVVLMYHRVAEVDFDPFELAVSPGNFEKHLQVLKTDFNVIGVNELVDQLQSRSILSNSVCLTFDDGYADNFLTAKPLLEKYQCPAAFYIASEFIGKKELFWWDELQQILLNTGQLPSRLCLAINGHWMECDLENEGVLTKDQWLKHKTWLFTDPPVTQRCELYVSIWSQLKHLTYFELQRALKRLRNWAGVSQSHEGSGFPMTGEQLQSLGSHPLFEIGVHTCTHPSLTLHNKDIQYQEIVECRDYLEHKFSKSPDTLSYPYGDYNESTLSIVKKQNFRGGFSTREKNVTKRTDPVCMGRFQVKNWTDSEFKKQLAGWFRK